MDVDDQDVNRRRIRRRRRRIVACILGVLIVLVGVPYVISRVRAPSQRIRVRSLADEQVADRAAELRSLKVLTYNIAHGRGPVDDNWEESGDAKRKRISQIAQLLKQTDADFVVINEVDFYSTWSGHQNQAEALAREAGYHDWVEQRNVDFRFLYGGLQFGNAILSRFPIVAAEEIAYPAHSAWEDWLAGRKRGVVCTLKLPGDRQLRVAAIHLEHRREINRVRGAEIIVDLARSSEIPLIAAGDFNSSLPGFPRANITADGKNAMEILQASELFRLRPQQGPQPADLTYSSAEPEQVIDWILIPASSEFDTYAVIKSELSDHRPVSATVILQDQPGGG